MAAQQYNPWNVRNPIGDHTARLRQGQQLRIVLDNPSVFDLPVGSNWHVQADGRYLTFIKENVIQRKEMELGEYLFGYHHVPSRWEGLSTLFLGNVHIFTRYPGEKQKLYASVCVFLNCTREGKEDVITVVEPTDICTGVSPVVKLEPSQLLEVIVTDENRERLNWSDYIFPAPDADPKMQLRRIRSVTLGFGDPGGNDVNNLFHCERRVMPYGDGKMPLFAEHHFFFSFQQVTQEVLGDWSNGNYDVCQTVLMAKDQEGKIVQEDSLHIVLALRSKVRKREKARLQPNRSFISDPLERIECLADRTIINPGMSERITLCGQDDRFLVEIAQPSYYFRQASQLIGARWRCEVGPLLLNDKKRHCSIEAVKLHTRTVDGIVFQRFGITSYDVSGLKEEMVLGEVILTCHSIDKLVIDHERHLHIILRKEPLPASAASAIRTVGCNGDSYNVVNYTGASCSMRQHQQQGKKGKNKNKNRAPQHWEISIEDFGTELVTGEHIEPTVLNAPVGSAFTNPVVPLLPLLPHSLGSAFPYGEWGPEDVRKWNMHDPQFYHDEKAKKKATEWLKELITKRQADSSKKSSVKNVYDNPARQKERRTDTTMCSGNKMPLIICQPKHGDEITLQTGQRLILRMFLPKGNYKRSNLRRQWCVNLIPLDDSLKIWIYRNQIVEMTDTGYVMQECEVLILTPKGSMPNKGASYPLPGIHRAGSLCFDAGDGETKRIDLNLEVTKLSVGSDVPLNWWIDYFKSHSAARPANFGLPYEAPQSYMDGRITLVNPKGAPDLELRSGDEVEIILNEPESLNKKEQSWNTRGKMLGGGEIQCLDNAYHTLPNGARIYRALFRVDFTEDTSWGEIKLYFDGEEQKTRIILIKWRSCNDHSNHIIAPHKEESKFGQLVRAEADSVDSRQILLRDWHDGQHAVIFPTDHVHIQVPRVRNYLDDSLKHSQKESAWTVEFTPYFLEDSIMNLLEYDVDPYAPWKEGAMLSSDKPWDGQIYVLPKLDEGQPYIYEILEAMREVYGGEACYPFAELTFSYQVNNQFTIRQSLQLDLGNLEFDYDIESREPIVVDNPADKSIIAVTEGSLLRLTLPQRWDTNQKTGEHIKHHWVLCEHPTWLRSLGYEMKKNKAEFAFIGALPAKHTEIAGHLQFELGDKKRKKRIKVVCKESMT